jgi:hypothetical protein
MRINIVPLLPEFFGLWRRHMQQDGRSDQQHRCAIEEIAKSEAVGERLATNEFLDV